MKTFFRDVELNKRKKTKKWFEGFNGHNVIETFWYNMMDKLMCFGLHTNYFLLFDMLSTVMYLYHKPSK